MAQISVIIPAYNQAAYIVDAIQSVLNQTFIDWEIIVVNDGSTDNTLQILAGFQDSRIHVISKVNDGVSAARNTGILHSSAPIVTFLDADDLLLNEQMATLYTYLLVHPEVGMAIGCMQKMDSSGRILDGKVTKPTHIHFPELFMGNDIQLSGVMIRRTWLDKSGYFDESFDTCEDWDLWLRLLLAGCQISPVEQVVVAYRIHTGQVTGNMTKMREGTLRLWDKFFGLPDLPPELLAYRNLATSLALVRTAARAFRIGEYELGNQDLVNATKLEPDLCQEDYKRLVYLLIGWADDPQTQDPEAYLLAIYKHITPELPELRTQLRKALAAKLLEPMFTSSSEALRTRKKMLLKAVWYDPSWLMNRGVLRMIVDAWLPLHLGRTT